MLILSEVDPSNHTKIEMKRSPQMMTKVVVVLLTMLLAICCAKMNRATFAIKLSLAAPCTVNATHCHCAMSKPYLNEICYQPVEGKANRCNQVPCASAYKCDCASRSLCRKLSTVYYTVKEQPNTNEFDCDKHSKHVPKIVTGRTTDFHLVVHQMFSLFVNRRQIGYGLTPEYNVITSEVKRGDIIGVIMSQVDKYYGIKIRFKDLEGEIRVMDENWRCSNSFEPTWLHSSFDAVDFGWTPPSSRELMTEDSFDRDVPWMWHGHDDISYCRYKLP